jgi:hypothetical protein
MLRHSVLWVMREPFSEDARLAMLRRLALPGHGVPDGHLRRLRRGHDQASAENVAANYDELTAVMHRP